MKQALILLFSLFSFVANAQQTTILVHNIPTNATTPLTPNSCLYVDQNTGGSNYIDTKVCNNWAAVFGGLTAANNGSDIPNPASFWTAIGGGALGKQAFPTQSALLGSSGVGLTNVTLGTNLSMTSNNVLNASGGATSIPCGNPGQIQYNNSGQCGGFDANGDFTIVTSTGIGTLATVNSTVGSFATVTINAKGLATAGANLSGDCTTTGSVITCTKTNGAAFATSATTDTTNAANITSGLLPATRLPNSGATAGTYNNVTVTVDATGRITAISSGSPTGVTWPANGTVVISNTTNSPAGITLSGDLTLNTTTGVATLASVNSNIGTFAATTINAKGLATAGAALSGDCSTSSAVITCTKTNGTLFAASATTDTTNAANISSGVIPAARIPASGVTAGSYTNTNITVGTDGRITAASSGSSAGVTWPANGTIVVSNTTNSPAGITPSGDWTINTTTGVATLASVNSNIGTFAATTINAKGLVTSATTLSGDCTTSSAVITCTKTNGTAFATSATTDTTNASNITSGTLGAARLATSGVTAGSYTLSNITVDVAGRVTAASNGAATGAIFVGNTTGSANTYTISSTTPSGFTLNDNYIVCGTISAINTGGSTLTVSPAAAITIVTQQADGLHALIGGELKASSQKYCFQYSSTSGVWVLQTVLMPNVASNQTSITLSQSSWVHNQLIGVTASGQTITLPTSSSLSPNGSTIINAIAAFTLAPTAASGNTIQTPQGVGAANASVVISQGTVAFITTDGAGHFYVNDNGTTSTGLSASGTNQAGALALTATFNVISTVSAGTGVALSSCTPNVFQYVRNSGANDLLVYTKNGDSAVINNLATTAGVTVPPNSTGVFTGTSLTQCYTVP